MVNKPVRQHHGAELESRVKRAFLGQKLRHMRAKPAHSALFQRDQNFMFTCQPQDHLFIQRLRKPRVCDSRSNPLRGQLLGSLLGLAKARAKAQKRHARALAHNTALTDLKRNAARRHLNAHALAARIPEGNRPRIIARRRGDHMLQLGLIRCRHHNHIGQVRKIGDVIAPRVRRPIGANKPRTVDRKAHR